MFGFPFPHLKDADAGFQVLSGLLGESPSCYMQAPPPPFVFRSGACVKGTHVEEGEKL